MSPLPDYFHLDKYNITPADVVRLGLQCEPEAIRESVVITPVWYRDLTAIHGHVVREISPRALEVEYRGVRVTVIRSDIGAPNTGDVVLALGNSKSSSGADNRVSNAATALTKSGCSTPPNGAER